jgi:hypothetical protein
MESVFCANSLSFDFDRKWLVYNFDPPSLYAKARSAPPREMINLCS